MARKIRRGQSWIKEVWTREKSRQKVNMSIVRKKKEVTNCQEGRKM